MDLSLLIQQLLDLALKSGAEAAEVFQAESLSRPIFFEANRLKQLERSQSSGIALRLWRNGSPGLAVAHGSVDPQRLVDKAIAISQLNQPEPIELGGSTTASYEDVGQTVPVEQLIEWGREAIAQVREAYPESICSAEWECEAETTRLVNTNGLDISYTDTTLSGYVSAEWIRGDDFLAVSDGQICRFELDPLAIAQQVIQRLQWAETNVTPVIGRVPVLFTSKAADMLWGTVHSALNGKQVLEKASPWSDRHGEQVLSPTITLAQAPEKGPFSCPFDDEGTQTRPITFIEKGVLQVFYCDRTVGNTLGSGTTGNGFRPGLGSYPTPGLFNSTIQPGDVSFEQLVQSIQSGIIVDQMLGGSAGISGEFSINIDLGYRIENGEIIGRVKDTMVSGNVYTALNQIIALGSDGEWNGACFTPSIIVEGLSVTGKE
ncbi:MAG: TldD/PmbA family protein [Merismopedia sp. SIO2A8]|nr:TldD/PmbA family protein [Merismopedia sp. SIO2A8]